MSDDVLLRFVEKNLIDVGGDDTKLKMLAQAASDLSRILKESPVKALAFSLVAFDPQVPEKDPVMDEVAGALQKKWATYVNTFPSPPVAIFRAMLAAALMQAARDNEAIAFGFTACARNVLPFMEVGAEEDIWTDVVAEVERHVEERAEAQWATPASIELPKINFNPMTSDEKHPSDTKVDKKNLAKQLRAAVGPQFTNPSDGRCDDTDGNQFFPRDSETWVYEFGPRAANAIGNAIEVMMQNLSAQMTGLSESNSSLTAEISKHLEKTVQAASVAGEGLQRRTNLLWWKEALFSPSAQKSYRDIPVSATAPLMAFDLYRQIPVSSPASVTAFLRETVMTLPNIDGGQKTAIRELVEDAGHTYVLAELRAEAARLVPAPPVGRGPALGLIGHPELLSQTDDRSFRDLVGVKPETQISLSDWSVWLLREFQAAQAVFEASAPRPKVASRRRTTRK